jgi:hypothetical protein
MRDPAQGTIAAAQPLEVSAQPSSTSGEGLRHAIKRSYRWLLTSALIYWWSYRTPTAAKILADLSDNDRAWLYRWFIQNGGDPGTVIPDEKVIEWYENDRWLSGQL